jgi:serine/threonine protein phosphatase PrpC
MRWEQTVEFAALSDIGFRRQNNEDSNAVLMATRSEVYQQFGHLFLVADGMGGHAVGELASKIAADTVPLAFQKARPDPIADALRKAIEVANTVIHNRGERNTDFRKMGTTCTTLVLSPQGATVGHIGDSRCYRIRGRRIDQLTFDHSLQWELIRQGKQRREDILLQQPRNVITRCLGPEAEVEVDIEGPFPVAPGDVYLLCSDGLTGLLSDPEIGLIARYLPPVEACRLLVDLANLRGGTDNVTVVIARVGDIPEGLSESSVPVIAVRPDRTSWGWFAAWCGWGILLAISITLMLSGRVVEGLMVMGGVVIGFGALIISGLRLKPLAESVEDRDDTVLWRPHRSADFKLSSEFLGMLASLEQTLQATALEEGWSIDWSEHKTAYEQASEALAARQFEAALLPLGKAIHVLMASIQEARRRMDRAVKWGGKTPLPANRNKPASDAAIPKFPPDEKKPGK